MIKVQATTADQDGEQRFNPGLLLVADIATERTPKTRFHSRTETCDVTFKRRAARQQNLVRDQPARCAFAQNAGTIRADPTQSIRPLCQSKANLSLRVVNVAIRVADFSRVRPAKLARAI